MAKNIGVDAAKLAGLQIDQNQKLRNGQMTVSQMEWWLNQTTEMREGLASGELIVSKPILVEREYSNHSWNHSWREENGVIYFLVTSDGTPGPDWIKRLKAKGFQIGDYTKSVLCSPDFKPTFGVATEVAILKGILFSNNDRITKKICNEAERRNLVKPNLEVACFIREKFTDEEIEAMGLWWVVTMHEPVKDSSDDPYLLGVSRDDGGHWLYACSVRPGLRWAHKCGFAFVFSQVSSGN